MRVPDRHAARALARTAAVVAGIACASAGATAAERFCDGPPSPIDLALESELARSGGVTVAIRAAQAQAYAQWDQALNADYRELLARLPVEARTALVETQRAWLVYRDDESRFLWSPTMLGQEGTLGPIVVGDRMREILKARVCELQASLKYLSLSAPAKRSPDAASAAR